MTRRQSPPLSNGPSSAKMSTTRAILVVATVMTLLGVTIELPSCNAFTPTSMLRHGTAFLPRTTTAETTPFLSIAQLATGEVTSSIVSSTTGLSVQEYMRQPQQRSAVLASTALFMARRGGGGGRRPGQRRGMPQVDANRPKMNDEIEAQELRVMLASPSGGKDEPLGVLSRDEALVKAKELGGLDVILINPNSDPPVCKIVDYSKFRYMREKKAKEVKKNSKASELKEVKMSYKIDVHDYDVRKKNASKFLKQGNRVKCTVMFRGREVQHDQLGFELLEKLAEDLQELAVKEGRPKREGRNLARILSPKPEVMKAVSDGKRAEEKAKKKKREAAFKKKQEELEEGVAAEEEAAVAATAIAELEEKASVDDLLSALRIEEEDGDSGDGSSDDDDVESSLDALLGTDDLTDDLFS